MQHFEEYYNFFSQALTAEIDLLKRREPVDLYLPVVYTLNMGGKRIRPVLLLMAYGFYSKQYSKGLPAAMAIELFHNFTLLHDDIMDHAELRRGRKTVHIEYSNNTAILSGDAMSILSYEYMTKIETPHYREIMTLFTQTALQICEGQQYDMDFEKRTVVDEKEYLHMIGLKTAVLIAASLKIGALMADAPAEDADWLYQFGYKLGIAFQLQDDLLDTFGNQHSFGKAIGGDIEANKKTYLVIKAFELADAETKAELEKWFSTTSSEREKKFNAVFSIFDSLNIYQVTREQIDIYYQDALSCLAKVSIADNHKTALFMVAQELMMREK